MQQNSTVERRLTRVEEILLDVLEAAATMEPAEARAYCREKMAEFGSPEQMKEKYPGWAKYA